MLPMRDLKVLIDVIPLIEAEESLRTVQQLAVGSGNMNEQDSRRILESWTGGVSGKTPIQKRTTPRDMLAFAQTSGVKVVSQ